MNPDLTPPKIGSRMAVVQAPVPAKAQEMGRVPDQVIVRITIPRRMAAALVQVRITVQAGDEFMSKQDAVVALPSPHPYLITTSHFC